MQKIAQFQARVRVDHGLTIPSPTFRAMRIEPGKIVNATIEVVEEE